MNEARRAADDPSPKRAILWPYAIPALLLAAVLGRGCVLAFSPKVYLLPRVSGRVTVGGKPIAGATVSWYGRSWASLPEWPLLGQTSTDASGQFVIAARMHRRMRLPIPGDPLTGWRMRVDGAGPRVATWEEIRISLGAPAWVEVDCDFSQERACRVVSSADPRLAEGARFEYAAADRDAVEVGRQQDDVHGQDDR